MNRHRGFSQYTSRRLYEMANHFYMLGTAVLCEHNERYPGESERCMELYAAMWAELNSYRRRNDGWEL